MEMKYVWLQDGRTALHIACTKSDFQMVQILVEKGADLAAKDKVSHSHTYTQTSKAYSFKYPTYEYMDWCICMHA